MKKPNAVDAMAKGTFGADGGVDTAWNSTDRRPAAEHRWKFQAEAGVGAVLP
jgi:hypothetical protein